MNKCISIFRKVLHILKNLWRTLVSTLVEIRSDHPVHIDKSDQNKSVIEKEVKNNDK